MIVLTVLLITIYMIVKWFKAKTTFFDEKNIKNIKPTLFNQMFFQNRSLPDIVNDWYITLKDSKWVYKDENVMNLMNLQKKNNFIKDWRNIWFYETVLFDQRPKACQEISSERFRSFPRSPSIFGWEHGQTFRKISFQHERSKMER